jgi:hypothetical protein
MTLLVATLQAATYSNTAAASVTDVSRAALRAAESIVPAPPAAKLNTTASATGSPRVSRWYDDPNALRGL